MNGHQKVFVTRGVWIARTSVEPGNVVSVHKELARAIVDAKRGVPFDPDNPVHAKADAKKR